MEPLEEEAPASAAAAKTNSEKPARKRLLSFVGDRLEAQESTLSTGIIINKLTSGMKWQERVMKMSEDGEAIVISTKKVLGSDNEIPIADIRYIQVGSEDIDEEHESMVEPKKTVTNSKASLYISAGDASVRIRLSDEKQAASLAAELRGFVQKQRAAYDDSDNDNDGGGGGGGGGDDDSDNGC